MKVWLYCICRDEIKILPYFLRHYVPWVEKLIFYDDKSEDGTREMISGCAQAELRDWPGSPGIVDDEFLEFANEQWKEARGKADWVIWVDTDEFIYHPNIMGVLRRYWVQDVEVPQVEGFTMVSDHFPTTDGQIYDEIRTGFRDGVWDKHAIFRVHMYWNMGRHSINFDKFNPKSSPEAELKLLHYRCLGMDYLRWRHQRNWDRVPERCRKQNLGTNCYPRHTGHHSVEWFEEMSKKKWTNVI